MNTDRFSGHKKTAYGDSPGFQLSLRDASDHPLHKTGQVAMERQDLCTQAEQDLCTQAEQEKNAEHDLGWVSFSVC